MKTILLHTDDRRRATVRVRRFMCMRVGMFTLMHDNWHNLRLFHWHMYDFCFDNGDRYMHWNRNTMMCYDEIGVVFHPRDSNKLEQIYFRK